MALVRDHAGSVTHRVELLRQVVLAASQEPCIAASTQAIATTRDISHEEGRAQSLNAPRPCIIREV